jgi:hypothetical protein
MVASTHLVDQSSSERASRRSHRWSCVVRTGCSRLTAAAILLCPGIAGAAEAAGGDLRIAPELRPLDFSYTIDDGGGTRSGEDSFDGSMALGIRGWWAWPAPGRWWAPAVAGEILAAESAYGNGGLSSYGARVLAGIAWRADDSWGGGVWLATGLGESSFDIPGDGSFTGLQVSGGYREYGLVVGLEYALTRRIIAVGELGWWERDHDLAGDGAAVTVAESGPSVQLGLAWRFGGAPASVE